MDRVNFVNTFISLRFGSFLFEVKLRRATLSILVAVMLTLAVTTVFVAVPARAQESDSKNTEKKDCIVQESVNIDDNKDSIVVTEQEIIAMKANRMADLLNHVPGVTAGDSSVSIHGSYKVKVFVDGRPINDPSSSHGSINWEMVSPDEVERIEILRGKGGSRYGQDAGGGVILVTTRRIGRLTGNIKSYGGNYGTGYGYVNLQKHIDGWGIALTGGAETTDGYKVNNDKRRFQTGVKIDRTFDQKRRIWLAADYLDDDRGLSGLPEYPTPFSRKSTENSSISIQGVYLPFTGTIFFNEGLNHNTDTSRGLDKVLRANELGQELTTSLQTDSWGDLNLGGSGIIGRASGSSFDDQQEERFSIFATHALKCKDAPVSLTSGIRANFNSAFEDAVNPELKLTYKKSCWHISTTWSRSNNIPSFYQRYNQTSSTMPNPDLGMETADNYALSFFIEPQDSFSGSISIFYNRLNDRITYVTGDDGVGQYQNFGLVTYKGSDLAASWRPSDSIKLNASYTYLEVIDENSDLWIPAQSRHKTRFDLYWHPVDPLSIVVGTQYNSMVYRNKNNTKTVPEYFLVNLRAEYAFNRFNLFGEINNMFDKSYYYADGLTAPPMTWFVGVNWKI